MKITSLWIYPIKSCHGFNVHRARVTSYGLENDRKYMVIDASGNMISQRNEPRMVLVRPYIGDTTMVVHDTRTHPKLPHLDVPLHQVTGSLVKVSVHNTSFMAVDQGDLPALWFSEFLGKECRLVLVPTDLMREKQISGTGIEMKISCHDSSSIHLLSEESLAHLSDRLVANGESREYADAERFRPNIVMDGIEPHGEDTLHGVQIGSDGVVIGARKKTERCIMTTVNPKTGERDNNEPLRTLRTYRLEEMKETLGARKVVFGMYFFPYTTGMISVGDTVKTDI